MRLTPEKEQKLDEKLKELAKKNFDLFCIITSVDKIQAFVCMENQEGKSYGQIAQVLGISREAVFQRCKKCE